MGLLDQIWDNTVAGPRPESGLGKLRKHSTFSFRSNSGKVDSRMNMCNLVSEEPEVLNSGRSIAEDAVRVTRSIMIVKPPQANQDSPPISPAGSTPPASPFAGAGGREAFRFRRRSASFAYEKANGGVEPRSLPPPFDL